METSLTMTPPDPVVVTRGGKPVAALVGSGHMTRVHWKAEVKQLGGLLKAVPAGLIRGAAQKDVHGRPPGFAAQGLFAGIDVGQGARVLAG